MLDLTFCCLTTGIIMRYLFAFDMSWLVTPLLLVTGAILVMGRTNAWAHHIIGEVSPGYLDCFFYGFITTLVSIVIINLYEDLDIWGSKSEPYFLFDLTQLIIISMAIQQYTFSRIFTYLASVKYWKPGVVISLITTFFNLLIFTIIIV